MLVSTISTNNITWINLMFHKFSGMLHFPPRHIMQKYLLDCFCQQYPLTRIIIDAKEFPVEVPSSLAVQSATWSSYKNRNTTKVLVCIPPRGNISFVSRTVDGPMSDKELIAMSGLVDLLEEGDEVMSDKGFEIQDILSKAGAKLVIPPFLHNKQQMAAADVHKTKRIANLHIHVERSI